MEVCVKSESEHSDHKHNGLITKIWGGSAWTFEHAITFGYPVNPTPEDKIKYKNHFESLADVLPCRYCRDSYRKFITTGDTKLSDEVLANRDTLTKWFHKIHDMVNDKLEIDYGITYPELVKKFESFRAKCSKSTKTTSGCVAPLDYKAFSFRQLYEKDAPIVPLEKAKQFVSLARKRRIDPKYFSFIQLAEQVDGDFTALKKLDSWPMRNRICQKIIKTMRINGESSIETDGPWKGTPTINELKLLMFLSSNLNRSELDESIVALKKLNP